MGDVVWRNLTSTPIEPSNRIRFSKLDADLDEESLIKGFASAGNSGKPTGPPRPVVADLDNVKKWISRLTLPDRAKALGLLESIGFALHHLSFSLRHLPDWLEAEPTRRFTWECKVNVGGVERGEQHDILFEGSVWAREAIVELQTRRRASALPSAAPPAGERTPVTPARALLRANFFSSPPLFTSSLRANGMPAHGLGAGWEGDGGVPITRWEGDDNYLEVARSRTPRRFNGKAVTVLFGNWTLEAAASIRGGDNVGQPPLTTRDKHPALQAWGDSLRLRVFACGTSVAQYFVQEEHDVFVVRCPESNQSPARLPAILSQKPAHFPAASRPSLGKLPVRGPVAYSHLPSTCLLVRSLLTTDLLPMH